VLSEEGGIYVPTRTFLVATVTLLMAVALALFTLTINVVREHTINIALIHARLAVAESQIQEHKDEDHAGRD